MTIVGFEELAARAAAAGIADEAARARAAPRSNERLRRMKTYLSLGRAEQALAQAHAQS
jgi:hypothetical protein